MGLRLDGRNPLAYMGVRPQQAAGIIQKTRRPTSRDVQNFDLGTFWFIPKSDTSPSQELWQLMGNAKNVASWVHIADATGNIDIKTITGNSGGAILPDSFNNLNLVGSGGVVVTGTPLNNTLTISSSNNSLFAQLLLTSQDLKSLTPTSCIQFIPSPGAGKMIVPLQYTWYFNYGGTSVFTFDNNEPLVNLGWGTSGGVTNVLYSLGSFTNIFSIDSGGYVGVGFNFNGGGNQPYLTNIVSSMVGLGLYVTTFGQNPFGPITGNIDNNNYVVIGMSYFIMDLP